MEASAFLELRVGDLLDELAGSRSAPGGGTALGVTAALAAAVLAMAGRVSRDGWPDAGGVVAQAQALRRRAAALAQLDAETYEMALVARDIAAELPPEQRDWEIGKAFAAAAEPPLEIARIACDVAQLAAEVATHGEPRIHADAAAAAALAAAVARGCVEMVAVNLTATEDDERVAEARVLATQAEQAARRAISPDQ